MRSLFTTPATVARLAYVSDVGSYVTQSGTIYGYFAPLDQEQRPADAKIGSQGFKFTCDGSSNIVASDRLTISSVQYMVRGLRRYTMGSLDLLDVLLEKSVKT